MPMAEHRWSSRYAGSALLIALAAGVSLAAFLPVARLSRLGLAPVSIPPFGIQWTDLAVSPNLVHRAAVSAFFGTLLSITVGVLLVAALTVISIGVVRASARSTEMAIRRAVGASRRRLLTSVLGEWATIAGIALVLGGAAGWPLARLLQARWPGVVHETGMAAVLAGVAGIAGAVLIAALLPMLGLRRRVVTAPTGKPLELIVAGFQFGISLTVLGATTLLSRETAQLNARATQRGNGRVYEVAARGTPAERSFTYSQLIHRLQTDSTLDISLTSFGAYVGLGMRDLATTDCGRCTQGLFAVPIKPVLVAYHAVSADTFRTMDVNVITGRGIGDDDGWDAPRVAVVSSSLAHDHFERQGAVGRNIQIGEGLSNWYRVVGVVDDLEPTAFGGALGPRYAVYLSALQHPPVAAQLLVRPHENAPPPDVSATLGDLPGVTTGGARIDEAALVRAETAPIQWFGSVISLEGWVVLILAVASAFVLMHLWVLSVRHEIGVRRAVGASRVRVLGFIVSRSLAVVAGGVLFACWLGIMVWGSLSATISGLPEWDPSVLTHYVPLLAIAAVAGALVPAARTLRRTPAEVLASD